jgi:hypothetical protein
MISGGGISGMTEKVCNLIVNGEEALRLSGRFEALHDALSPSGGLGAVPHDAWGQSGRTLFQHPSL